MRILWYNKIQTATITVTSESTFMSANFPKENILVNALSIPFKSIQPTAEMIITFDALTTINCIGLAGHNLTALRYRTYDKSDVLIDDVSVTSVRDTDVFYLDTELVKKIKLNMTSDVFVQIGYLSAGEYYAMPDPNAFYDENYEINNVRSTNAFGQVYGSDGAMLRRYEPNFTNVHVIQFKEIVAIIEATRNYKTLFVDMTESNHDYKEPLYATLDLTSVSSATYSRGFQRKTINLSILEAR